MDKHDLIVSLGNDFVPAMALKLLKITEKTYPFDWSACDGDVSERLLKKCDIIKKHFRNEFNVSDFIEYFSPELLVHSIKNTKNGIYYAQGFASEQSVKDFFPEFLRTYQRRIKRLYDDIESANNILFIYQDTITSLPLNTIKNAINILKKSFPNKNINLFVFLPIISTKAARCYEIKTNIDNVRVFACIKPETQNYEKRVDLFAGILEHIFNNAPCPLINNDDIISVAE